MEKFRKHFKLKKSVKYWVWLGRLAPLSALVMLLIATTFEMTTFTSWVVLGICILFAITAFTWWWWVMFAVRDIFNLLQDAITDQIKEGDISFKVLSNAPFEESIRFIIFF